VKKVRADVLLVERGLCASRERAKVEIMSGRVFVGSHRVAKASETFEPDVQIRIEGGEPYVSRAGRKLEHALRYFDIQPEGWVCLDIGASTGGFTDCLLKHGAAHVTALDVGHSQIAWTLRNDHRVRVVENTNARYLCPDDFEQKFDLVVMDVSFISQRLIHPVIKPLLQPRGCLITLIKPQFEARREEVGKGGIIRDVAVWSRVCQEVSESVRMCGFDVHGIVESPIEGGDGNREFLLFAQLQ
jgi:23S rRNA (cytidine1920-2'-O)/16S rRNA (cytidine1409-2'-O)-methyltransferase